LGIERWKIFGATITRLKGSQQKQIVSPPAPSQGFNEGSDKLLTLSEEQGRNSELTLARLKGFSAQPD
jgi:hypothetical protein